MGYWISIQRKQSHTGWYVNKENNMLKSTVIDKDYFDQVSEEIVTEKMGEEGITFGIKMVIMIAMVEFSKKMKDKLFGKMEDK
nr:MAG TPA: hypothetical protein [Caudoviricetes sp.]